MLETVPDVGASASDLVTATDMALINVFVSIMEFVMLVVPVATELAAELVVSIDMVAVAMVPVSVVVVSMWIVAVDVFAVPHMLNRCHAGLVSIVVQRLQVVSVVVLVILVLIVSVFLEWQRCNGCYRGLDR